MKWIINSQDALWNKTIGIIGFGHLGASLALPLIDRGFARERLLISCRGSEKTLARARALGLENRLTDTQTLMSSSDIIFVACRPQDLLTLPRGAVKEDALVVSCMAGLPLSLLSGFFGGKMTRMMCSGPDTIESGLGIAVICPAEASAEAAVRLMGIDLYKVGCEEELDSFTVGICIPPILINLSLPDGEVAEALDKMRERFPVYDRIGYWIKNILAAHSAAEQSACLENVMTKGGISESMYCCLKRGGTFTDALERGLERGREISDEMRQNVAMAACWDKTPVEVNAF